MLACFAHQGKCTATLATNRNHAKVAHPQANGENNAKQEQNRTSDQPGAGAVDEEELLAFSSRPSITSKGHRMPSSSAARHSHRRTCIIASISEYVAKLLECEPKISCFASHLSFFGSL